MALFVSLPNIGQLPVNVRALVAVGAVVLVGAGGYLGLVAPKLREVKTLKAQLAKEVQAGRSPQPLPSVPPIADAERALWGELEKRLQGRYPQETALPRAAAVLAELARASGMQLVSLEIRTPPPGDAADPKKAAAPPPFQPPSELTVNPSTIRLIVEHRYRDLVEFLDGLRRVPVYVTVQSLEVTRADGQLITEASFASFRWGK
ncbi:MAG: hypothetical protein HY613_05370 [Candidatus Rokubacteria bacterium]|nr:hypothetical protein [Candidatus Rokubacteria bacterium]